ncbi:protocatechuate 3,4-dioxygenase beta subunit [Humitalea rosea]|uniref:Protocatechuate 3,4-dioxygenase beta subunit n=1 Tax=Humitalea rosea TaxID=990373 RepID=A0A2W7IDM4_9PROT|nr:protocatechuate 3,4-dioxygenase subunit beta [Humitalea rosea]PZW44831.1 protocatechuate 3,4-dioxygenase beta subunit [Humitalea rosea]
MQESARDPQPFRPPAAGTQPSYDTPAYLSTRARHPTQALVLAPHTVTETTGPRFTSARFPSLADISGTGAQAAQGERIIVGGRVLDEDGRPVPHTMVEIWQANAAGRYAHALDQHNAPLDPNFHGVGRVFSDAEGRWRFVTIKPGAYPWRNHANAWRPNHIHFSLFGQGFAQRLITQMYFPGDPLLPLDPIFNCVPDVAARDRLIADFDLEITQPEYALGYRFDIVLRGRGATPFEEPR